MTQMKPNAEAIAQPTLLGEWRTTGGYIYCGTLRVARANFDTNPTDQFRDRVFQEICNAMNALNRTAPPPSPVPADTRRLETCLRLIQQNAIRNNVSQIDPSIVQYANEALELLMPPNPASPARVFVKLDPAKAGDNAISVLFESDWGRPEDAAYLIRACNAYPDIEAALATATARIAELTRERDKERERVQRKIKELNELREVAESEQDFHQKARKEADALRAENAQLRVKLKVHPAIAEGVIEQGNQSEQLHSDIS